MKCYLYLVVIGERYRALAQRAAKRWLTLLPELAGVVIAGEEEAKSLGIDFGHPSKDAWMLKLHAWDLLAEDADAFLYADLDLLPLNPIRPSVALFGVDLAVVRDRWDEHLVYSVSDHHGIPRQHYFNAGLIYARRSCAAAFEKARDIAPQFSFWDQTALNITRISFGLKTTWLAWRYNPIDALGNEVGLCGFHEKESVLSALEAEEYPAYRPFPKRGSVIEEMDFDDPLAPSKIHLHALSELASDARHVLELGKGCLHSSWAMAAAGAQVSSISLLHEKNRRLRCQGLEVDVMSCGVAEWFERDDGWYDLICSHGQEGARHLPYFQQCWDRLVCNGTLAILGAERVESWGGDDLTPKPVNQRLLPGDRARALLLLTKGSEEEESIQSSPRSALEEFCDVCWEDAIKNTFLSEKIQKLGLDESEIRLLEELTSYQYLYRRVGYDERLMDFERGGAVGLGAAGCEVRWEVVRSDVDLELELHSRSGLTCKLRQKDTPNWQGEWVIFERMPIVLKRQGRKTFPPRECGGFALNE